MVSIEGSEDFPNLKAADFEVTSGETAQYNCLAWAVDVIDEWWEPSADGVWPGDVPRRHHARIAREAILAFQLRNLRRWRSSAGI